MYRTIHLTLSTHPSPTSQTTIDYACRAALYFGATLSVTNPQLYVRTPTHFIAGGILASVARDFEREAAAKSAELGGRVREMAKGIGVDVTIVPITEQWLSSPSDIAWRGRTSDLCILGLPGGRCRRAAGC